MCTVVIMPRQGGGFVLAGNRDERVTRAQARPPVIHDRGGLRWLAPIDPDGGGSWTSVNEAGCALSILNNYQVRLPDPPDPISRGQLVATLADAPDLETVRRRLQSEDLPLRRVRPFVLIAARGGPRGEIEALEASWQGQNLAIVSRELPWMRTSNGLSIARAMKLRGEAFSRHLGGREAVSGVEDAALDAFFSSHHPRADPWSVCMHLPPFARTVSHTRVEVGIDHMRILYREGSPCRPGEATSLELRRRR